MPALFSKAWHGSKAKTRPGRGKAAAGSLWGNAVEVHKCSFYSAGGRRPETSLHVGIECGCGCPSPPNGSTDVHGSATGANVLLQ